VFSLVSCGGENAEAPVEGDVPHSGEGGESLDTQGAPDAGGAADTLDAPDPGSDSALDADAPELPDISAADVGGGGDADAESDLDTEDGNQTEDTVTEHPDCRGFAYTGRYLLPGPCESGFDEALEAKATGIERCWRTLNASATGVNADVAVDLANSDDRAAIEAFCAGDSWDFEAATGKAPLDAITEHFKVAGLYAGVGIAADAFRYGVLRDQGYPKDEVDRARQHLLSGLEGLRRAVEVTGAPGVIARGYIRTDLPTVTVPETIPLFDADGAPNPPKKTNGTWRQSGSAALSNYVWEDSVSRDQMLGWVTGAAAAFEVIRDDASVPQAVVDALKADALVLGNELMKVRPSGYDLEFADADGRTPVHGYIHEKNVEGLYLQVDTNTGFGNGLHAAMALGFVAAWAYVSGDPATATYLHDQLIVARNLPLIVRESLGFVAIGPSTNYSNYNMAFGALWLATRYVEDASARVMLREALERFYVQDGDEYAPVNLQQSYFDFVYAAGMAGHRPGAAFEGELPANAWGPDGALTRGVNTLRDFPAAPYWDFEISICPGAQCTCENETVSNPECAGTDGLSYSVLGCVGHSCALVGDAPVPMKGRPPSNYHWRSNPFELERGGTGAGLLPAVDFRIAYWSARWAKQTN
jgi:hypothetical protein